MDQAASDYVLAVRVLHTGSIIMTHAVNGEVVRRGDEQDIQRPLNFVIYAALRPYINGAPVLP
jgi:hypothetical protein